MTLKTVRIQGVDGTQYDVLLDEQTDGSYSIPAYKLAIGEDGVNDGVVSSENPLPIVAYGSDGADLQVQKMTPFGQAELWQPELYQLLGDMLKELKKMNLQLALVTDTSITNQEVE